jgi:hypothetical protein
MPTHVVQWKSPSPIWGRVPADDQARPAILRFTTDDFMDQVLAIMADDPRKLGDMIARPESWRSYEPDTPDLVQRAPLPRIARMLARKRTDAERPTALKPTERERSTTEDGGSRKLQLKLYHPAHQRHYLVVANLVCAQPGLPDRSAGLDQLGFVMRRLVLPKNSTDDSAREEFAFIKDAAGAHWQRVEPNSLVGDPAAKLIAGEELLPLFPINFSDVSGQPRRLLAGAIPVGRREEYMAGLVQRDSPAGKKNGSAAAGAALEPGTTSKTARKLQFRMEVSEPWKNLVRSAYYTAGKIMDDLSKDVSDIVIKRQKQATDANISLQAQSWLILLDFADFLALHLPKVWDTLQHPAKTSQLNQQELALFKWLDGTGPGSDWQIKTPAFASNLGAALKSVRTDAVRGLLEGTMRTYTNKPERASEWPGFLYLLAGIREDWSTGKLIFIADGPFTSLGSLDVATATDETDANPQPPGSAETSAAYLDKLVQLVTMALHIDATTPAPPLPYAARLSIAMKDTAGDVGWFVLRCAYTRPDCGPLQPPIVSPPSQRFQLASFFDPDAPARPIRIALPLDTTPAGLRKFNKNTAFMMSDVLCGQVQRVKGLGFIDLVLSVLPWPFHKDLDLGPQGLGPCGPSGSIGMICSLSIPIITICALILMIMIVLVLDLIFKWIPWLIVCFPIPGLKAKK